MKSKKISFVDKILSQSTSAKESNPSNQDFSKGIDRNHISEDLAHLYAITERLLEHVLHINWKSLDSVKRESQALPIRHKISGIQDRIQEYKKFTDEEGVQLRKKDLEQLESIQQSCDRIDFILFGRKREAQKISKLKNINDERLKKILGFYEPQLDINAEGPVFIYEISDLGELSQKINILRGFEHNGNFIALFKSAWAFLPEKERKRQVKKLVNHVGTRIRTVRLVDEEGNIMGECQNREITLF